MVVIPESRGVLIVRIVVSRGFPWHIPILGIAIALGRRFRAMKVDDCADLRLALRAMEAIVNRQEVLFRQFVDK